MIDFTVPILLIEAVGALFIASYALVAGIVLVRSRDITRSRLLVVEGALWGLSIKLAASLLKTIELHDWTQILTFAAILALRTLLRQVFTWEQAQLERRAAR